MQGDKVPMHENTTELAVSQGRVYTLLSLRCMSMYEVDCAALLLQDHKWTWTAVHALMHSIKYIIIIIDIQIQLQVCPDLLRICHIALFA